MTLLVSVAIPALAFMLGGIAKTKDPFLAAQFISRALSLRLDHAFELARIVAIAEIVLAGALCFGVGRRRWPAYGAACLLAFFLGMLVTVALSDPRAASCGCFGGLMGNFLRRSLWGQVAIDLSLLALLALYLVLFQGPRRLAGAPDAAPTPDAPPEEKTPRPGPPSPQPPIDTRPPTR